MIENWLVYVGGWVLGEYIIVGILERLYNIPLKPNQFFRVLFSWTMIWVWICINFIASV